MNKKLIGAVLSTPRARLMWKEPLIRGAAGLSLALTLLCFARLFLNVLTRQG